jgi:hypothetical protein
MVLQARKTYQLRTNDEGNPVEPEEPSRGEALLEKLKATRLRPSQFRLTTIFGIMVLVGFLMAIPRFSGADYGWYFGFLYMILYGCAPFASWLLYFILPPTLGRVRMIVACVAAAAIVLPFWTLVGWYDGGRDLVEVIIVTMILFWLPQVICIWGVWHFLFRPRSRRG